MPVGINGSVRFLFRVRVGTVVFPKPRDGYMFTEVNEYQRQLDDSLARGNNRFSTEPCVGHWSRFAVVFS